MCGGGVDPNQTLLTASVVESIDSTPICVGETHSETRFLAHSARFPCSPPSLRERLF